MRKLIRIIERRNIHNSLKNYNVPIEDAIYSHDKRTLRCSIIRTNLRMPKRPRNQEIISIKLKERRIQNKRACKTRKKLLDYIKLNFDREKDFHSAVKKNQLATLDIKTTSSNFIIEYMRIYMHGENQFFFSFINLLNHSINSL